MSCGRPREGHVYQCYKMAKKAFRSAWRKAINCELSSRFNNINIHALSRNGNKFWKEVRKVTRGNIDCRDVIDTELLVNRFEEMFKPAVLNLENKRPVEEAENIIKTHYGQIENKI